MSTTLESTDIHSAWAASHRVAREIERQAGRGGVTVTWLNHWSAMHTDWPALERMALVGIDGTLLQLLLHRSGLSVDRSSADMVIPLYLRLRPAARVALVGGRPGVAENAAARLEGVVFTADGFAGLAGLFDEGSALVAADPDVIVLGLGTGLQDRVAAELHNRLPGAVIFTAGGWVDQLSRREQYFPPVVHRLRLGWLWRIAHEPRRLLRRYTIDAVAAVVRRRATVQRLRAATAGMAGEGLGFRGKAWSAPGARTSGGAG